MKMLKIISQRNRTFAVNPLDEILWKHAKLFLVRGFDTLTNHNILFSYLLLVIAEERSTRKTFSEDFRRNMTDHFENDLLKNPLSSEAEISLQIPYQSHVFRSALRISVCIILEQILT